ncbi:MAG: dienelactone hydrolase family protein [Actinomycetota bacterium]
MEIELASGAPADLYPVVGAKRGLVIAPDLMGRRKLFDDMAASLATAQSWNVIVVDPFRGRTFTTNTTEERHAVVGELDDDDVVGDLVDAANRLEVEPVALAGFCMGGMYTFKAGASHRFDRLVSFYGMIRIPDRWHGRGQREPLQLLRHAEDPANILAIVGTEDPYTPPDDVKELVAAGVEVVRYEGAQHAFVHDPSRPSHRPTDAADAWSRFHAHLAKRPRRD